jgi:AcrR family transcriptional regulator
VLDPHDAPSQDQVMEPADAPTRADARRNRTAILEAAEAAFADEGLGVPVDDIARRAGVGPGTVYRNFPTKEALFEAVIMRHMDVLAAEASSLVDSAAPADALFAFLRRMADEAGSKRNLVEALLAAGGQFDERLDAAKQRIRSAAEALLERAQRTGEVRDDVTVDDLFGMVIGCAMRPQDAADTASSSRMVTVMCDGLRRGDVPATRRA